MHMYNLHSYTFVCKPVVRFDNGVGGGRQWGLGDTRYLLVYRLIYDHTHFPINFTAALPIDLQLIGPEIVVEIRGEIKRRNYTYS